MTYFSLLPLHPPLSSVMILMQCLYYRCCCCCFSGDNENNGRRDSLVLPVTNAGSGCSKTLGVHLGQCFTFIFSSKDQFLILTKWVTQFSWPLFFFFFFCPNFVIWTFPCIFIKPFNRFCGDYSKHSVIAVWYIYRTIQCPSTFTNNLIFFFLESFGNSSKTLPPPTSGFPPSVWEPQL